MTDDGTHRGRAARFRDVFPWWYLGGLVVTIVVLAALDTDGAAAVAVWGAPTGILIRERNQTARRRRDAGLPVDRAVLTAPRGSEPATAVAFLALSVGLGFVLGAVIGDDPASQGWVGALVLVVGAALLCGVVLVARARHRRRQQDSACDGRRARLP